MHACVLGFDVEPVMARRLLARTDRSDPATIAILDAFADLCALAPERRDQDAETTDSSGAREYLNQYLRSLDPEREGLPEWFTERLRRALAHYGVTALEPGPDLEDALLRIFVAHLRRDELVPMIMTLLEGDLPTSGLRETLDRLIEATQRRFPAIASLSRAVRYSRFDRPHIERTRADVSATMQQLSRGLTASTPAEEVERLVNCPLPLVPILAEANLLADTASPGALLAVLTRRYYRIRALEQPELVTVRGSEVCLARYVHKGRTVHVIALRAADDQLDEALGTIAEVATTITAPGTVTVDIYIPFPGGRPATPTRGRLECGGSSPGQNCRAPSGASRSSRPAEVATSSRSAGPARAASGRTGWRPNRTRRRSLKTSSSAAFTR